MTRTGPEPEHGEDRAGDPQVRLPTDSDEPVASPAKALHDQLQIYSAIESEPQVKPFPGWLKIAILFGVALIGWWLIVNTLHLL